MNPTFTFYSIGDSAFMQQILNGVAMLSGNGEIRMVAMIGMVFGVIIIGFQAIENTSHIDWFKAIIGWVLYMIAFGSVATVAINDVYTGQVRMVSNVPVGVAIVGSWTSAIGQELTKKFEQAFSLPTMTSDGFASALKHLIDFRHATLDGMARTMNLPGVSYQKTLYNYLRDCTLPGIVTGMIDQNTFLDSDNPIAAMQFDNDVYGTATFLPQDAPVPPQGNYKGCEEAYKAIKLAFGSASFTNSLQLFTAAKMGLTKPTQIGNAMGILQNNIDSIVGFGKNARNYVMANVVRNMLASAEQGKALTEGNVGQAIIIGQAESQLNVQNAASGTLFMHFVHPLMTFMEGFIFAVTPIMMLLIATGSLGIRMVGKYLVMLIWVQLWMPVLAIINLYLNMVVSSKMAALQNFTHLSPTSIAGQVHAHATIMDWLGTAGMLASATPALTLMLVYGTSIAATHLAGRLSATDTIDEAEGAPPIMRNEGLLDMSPTSTFSTGAGLRGSDASAVTENVDFSRLAQGSVSSANSLTERSLHATQDAARQETSLRGSTSHREVVAHSAMRQVTESHGDSITDTRATLREFAHSHQMKNVDKFVDQATLAIASGDTYGAGVKVGATASGESADSIAADTKDAERYDLKHDFTSNFQKAFSNDIKGLKQDETGTSEDKAKVNAYATSLAKSSEAAKNYNHVVQASEHLGVSGKVNETALYANTSGEQLANIAAVQKREAVKNGVGREGEREANKLLTSGLITSTDRAAAIGYTIANAKHMAATGKSGDMDWIRNSLATAGFVNGAEGLQMTPNDMSLNDTQEAELKNENEALAMGQSMSGEQPNHDPKSPFTPGGADANKDIAKDANDKPAHFKINPPVTPGNVKARAKKLLNDNSTHNLKAMSTKGEKALQEKGAEEMHARALQEATHSARQYVNHDKDTGIPNAALVAARLASSSAKSAFKDALTTIQQSYGAGMAIPEGITAFGDVLNNPKSGESPMENLGRAFSTMGKKIGDNSDAMATVDKAMHTMFFDKAINNGLTKIQAKYYADLSMNPLLANSGADWKTGSDNTYVNAELAHAYRSKEDGVDEKGLKVALHASNRAIQQAAGQQDGYDLAWMGQFDRDAGLGQVDQVGKKLADAGGPGNVGSRNLDQGSVPPVKGPPPVTPGSKLP